MVVTQAVGRSPRAQRDSRAPSAPALVGAASSHSACVVFPSGHRRKEALTLDRCPSTGVLFPACDYPVFSQSASVHAPAGVVESTTRNTMREPHHGVERLIDAIDKPLGFFVLALLIVEGFLSTVLILSDLDSTAKAWGMGAIIGLFVLVVAVVGLLVWHRPTNLTFTGYEALVSMGKITYGTDRGEVAEKDLPSGTARPE